MNPTQTRREVERTARIQHPVGTSVDNFYTISKTFELLPAAAVAAGRDPDFVFTPLGTGTVPTAAFLAAKGGYGGVAFATPGSSPADNDAVAVFPASAVNTRWGQVQVPTAGQVIDLMGRVAVGASIASTAIIFGFKLTNTHVLATDADQALFWFDTDAVNGITSANWQVVVKTATVLVNFDTGIAVNANTDYELRVVIGGDLKARFYINGVQVQNAGVPFASAAFGAVNLVNAWYGVTRDAAGAQKTHGIRKLVRSRNAA